MEFIRDRFALREGGEYTAADQLFAWNCASFPQSWTLTTKQLLSTKATLCRSIIDQPWRGVVGVRRSMNPLFNLLTFDKDFLGSPYLPSCYEKAKISSFSKLLILCRKCFCKIIAGLMWSSAEVLCLIYCKYNYSVWKPVITGPHPL